MTRIVVSKMSTSYNSKTFFEPNLACLFLYVESQILKIILPKNEQTNLFFYPDDLDILETWISISSFKYFRAFRIEKQIRLFMWEKLRLDNFVSRSTDLYPPAIDTPA